MRIAIVGTGRMGMALGRQLAARHEMRLGSRDPARGREKAAEIDASFGGSYSDAAHETEAVFLAVPWEAVPETLSLLGDIEDAVLIDVTNPFAEGSVTELRDLLGSSGAEVIQSLAPEARVVKAFNYMYSGVLRHAPDFDGTTPTVLIAGDDADAKRTVAALVFDLGYEPIDAGALSSSRYVEPLAPLMTTLDRNSFGETSHALKLLRRERVRSARKEDDRARARILAGLSVDRPPA